MAAYPAARRSARCRRFQSVSKRHTCSGQVNLNSVSRPGSFVVGEDRLVNAHLRAPHNLPLQHERAPPTPVPEEGSSQHPCCCAARLRVPFTPAVLVAPRSVQPVQHVLHHELEGALGGGVGQALQGGLGQLALFACELTRPGGRGKEARGKKRGGGVSQHGVSIAGMLEVFTLRTIKP
jgi:hypothetical protein